MSDRYSTRLFAGIRVADLREGKQQEGRALGPTGDGRLLVAWDGGDEEDVPEDAVVAVPAAHGGRRRRG